MFQLMFSIAVSWESHGYENEVRPQYPAEFTC